MTRLSDILSPAIKDFRRPRRPVIEVSTDSDFCRESVSRGLLTQAQMEHAAAQYRLGRSRSGKTIFWMIDDLGIVRDGRIGDAWVSQMMKAREPRLFRWWYVQHCLFGLHLLSLDDSRRNAAVSIVESERSAVILSELLKKNIWLATADRMNFNILSLQPLTGRKVAVFPRTDPLGENYVSWLEMADYARRTLGLDISVKDVLEKNASSSQKERQIDILEYITE